MKQYESGLRRSDDEGKIDYTHVLDGPMLDRWAWHMTRNVKNYGGRNWLKATPEDEERFKASLLRHVIQFIRNEPGEDHAAAIMYNVNGLAYIRDQILIEMGFEPINGPRDWPE